MKGLGFLHTRPILLYSAGQQDCSIGAAVRGKQVVLLIRIRSGLGLMHKVHISHVKSCLRLSIPSQHTVQWVLSVAIRPLPDQQTCM